MRTNKVKDGLNVQNLKKSTVPTATKHFMSQTISAASKANPPRKKILAERNESLDSSLQKTHDSKTTQKTTSLDSRTASSIESGDNQENALIDDLSSRPYDPLTNYLSPRPKFLRYKPNRRREMFLERENRVKEGEDCSLESNKGIELISSCGSLAAETNVEQEFEESDDSDGEFEEVVEERGCWGLRGVLEVLFLMGVLAFFTSYISSMNSPTPSLVVQTVVNVKDGYHLIQDHVYEFVQNLDTGKLYLVNREGIQMGFADSNRIKEEEEIEEVKIEEAENNNDELSEVFVDVQSAQIKVEEMVENVDEFIGGGENEAMETVEYEEKVIVDEVSDASNLEIAQLEEVFLDQVETDSELQGQDAVEVLDLPLKIVSSVADAIEKENEGVNESIKVEILDRELGGTEKISDEAEVTEKESLIKLMETESTLKLVTGFCVLSSILASLLLWGLLHFRKNRNARNDSHPDSAVEPCFNPAPEEKCNSLLANKKDEQHIEHPVSFANSRSLMQSLEEDSKQTHESGAPTVELLGELVVGEMSSSLRNCSSMRSRMIESEVSSHSISMEKGKSSKSNSVPVHLQSAFSEISMEKGKSSKSNSVPVHLQSAFSEIPTLNFASTADEKRILKTEGGGDGEEVQRRVVTTTPLRRSSRLRNRAMSP